MCQCSCKITRVTMERRSANASSSIPGTAAGGEPGIYAVLVKCWYHLSACLTRESFSSTGEAQIFCTCCRAFCRRADLLLAVTEWTMGGYAGSLTAASVWTSFWFLKGGRFLGNSKGTFADPGRRDQNGLSEPMARCLSSGGSGSKNKQSCSHKHVIFVSCSRAQ
uniref:Uncharacterized protein n=1 Tax=Dicentrarchus labrax TaxID=13489 RepID=A0A8C4NWL8_DICLA